MSPRSLRLRECGLAASFKSVLNVRGITIKRELRDVDLKFDERIAPRQVLYTCWVQADDAHVAREPPHTVEHLDTAYSNALCELEAATARRDRRIESLKAMLVQVKAARRV
jgi:hypothetical protein